MQAAAPAGLAVRPQCPLRLPDRRSQSESDFAVVPPSDCWDAHASDAMLVIEVSVTSRAVDLGRKAASYAAAGVPSIESRA